MSEDKAVEAAPAAASKPAASKKKKTVTKRGRASTMVSAGSKYDAAENKPGSQGDPEVEREIREEREVPVVYSKVAVTLGMTRSLGNFEFARVDVTIEDFCAPDQKKETFEALHKDATAMVGGVVKDIDAYLKKKRDRAKGTTAEPKVETPESQSATIDTSNMGF